MHFSGIQVLLIGTVCFPLFSGHSSSRRKYLTQHYGMKGWVLKACLSMMTILVHPGCLLKLTMHAAAAVEEDHPNSKNETRNTKGWKSSYSAGLQGLACSWSCMPKGCAMRMTKRLPKRMVGAASRTFWNTQILPEEVVFWSWSSNKASLQQNLGELGLSISTDTQA